MKKQDYLDGLKELGIDKEDNADPAVAAEPTKPAEAVAAPVDEAQSAAPQAEAAPQEQPNSHGAPEGAPAAPVQAQQVTTEPEPIKGWSLLPEETRKELQERFERAQKLDEQLKRREHEYNLSQQRLAPTQQQLARLQAEHAKLQKQINERSSTDSDAVSKSLQKRLNALREQFPEEADVIEGLTQNAYKEAEDAKKQALEVKKRLEEIESRQVIGEQLQVLAQAHPDWRESRQSPEFNVWINNLDPYKANMVRPLLSSRNAADAIFVLNEFKRDLAWAQALNGQQHAPPPSEAASTQSAQAPSVPAPDPAPKRRTTAPASPAGQPISDKKREFLRAVEVDEKQRLFS